MPVPVVTIEISAPAPPATSSLEALLAACNDAAAEAECVDSESGSAERTPAAVAIVAWQSDEVARLEVGVRRDNATRWSMRRIEFSPEDEPAERWRTVGFVIGTIVGESSAQGAMVVDSPVSEEPTVEQPSAAKIEPIPNEETSPEPSWGWGELAAIASPADIDGPWLAGAQARAVIGPQEWPLYPSVSGAFAWQLVPVESIRSSWLTVAFGAALPLKPITPPLFLDFRLEALVRQHRFASTLPNGERDEDKRWIGGGQVGVDLAWLFSSRIGLCLSADAFVLGGETAVAQFGDIVRDLEMSAYGAQLSVGTRLAW